ncbi:autotransporter assembly complex protein TamA [Shimia gijangensis]|nr:BamA/TamA family outer membrane protein [Shimia gijangensis]
MKPLLAWVLKSMSKVAAGAVLAALAFSCPATAFEVVLKAPENFEKRLTGASLVFAAKEEGITDSQDIVATAQAEYRRLLGVLYSDGYFGPEISVLIDGREAATLPPFAIIRQVDTVELRVDPGPQFLFGKTDLAPLAPETALPEEFASGHSARTGVITHAASGGVSGWRNIGHAKARVSDQSIIANHDNATLDVDVDLDPGPKLRFGNLRVSGETTVSEDRLVDIISLPSGETFSPQELDRIGKRLRRTGVFRSVSISESDDVGADKTLDIDVRLEDEKPRRLSFGAELESRDGLTLSTTWIRRNLFGGAERLKIDGEISGIGAQTGGTDFTVNVELLRPATFQADTDLIVGMKLDSIDDPLYQIDKFVLSASLNRIVSDQLTLSGGVILDASNSLDDYGNRQFRSVGLPARAIWDRRDDELDPSKGYFISGTFMPYASSRDGAPGLYLFGDSRTYKSVGIDRVVLAGRLQAGSIVGPSIAETQPDMLFLSGGGGTVRGQPYQSNFVTVNGRQSGGLSFVGLSGEVRVKTTNTISAVAFYDAGFVGESSSFSGGGNWQSGAGIGLRYHTSIGPIRVDLGWPVRGNTSGGTQLYIGIGQAF